MTDTPYAAHERLVAPCRPRQAIWRVLLGLVIVTVTLFVGYSVVLRMLTATGSQELALSFITGDSQFGMLLLLGCFGFMTLGVVLAARQLQRRGLQSVTGDYRQMVRQFWQVVRLLFLLMLAVFLLPPYDFGAPLTPNLSLGSWLALLPLSLLAVLIQVSAEEILFRGYLQQSLAARFRSPLVWMLVPSILFAIGHYSPEQAGENALLIVGLTGLFGLLMADITARAGTLGPAIALHFANNVVALLIVGFPDMLSGLALYLTPFDMSDTGTLRLWLLVDLIMMVCAWLVARIAMRR
ncbi:CPBP family intramembrane metalloprotease [Ruegeria sp. 2205SS24-7]|uniref:CPBP family intramembrane glutamic endopeptidase n=1 Tax=Ruegeria discodermiae TaxID=3064389 RepID=UPI0027417C6A|nr:CPBP family intramembrane glutamic endopeptidase [Ruegeria sp. 2205SS24-7]MDP5219979.1 CPBP family intramembrane metalloprotease [Ruegeria sp. 2205SS24-7]